MNRRDMLATLISIPVASWVGKRDRVARIVARRLADDALHYSLARLRTRGGLRSRFHVPVVERTMNQLTGYGMRAMAAAQNGIKRRRA